MAQLPGRKPSTEHRGSFDHRTSLDTPPQAPSVIAIQPNVLDEEPYPRIKNVAPCIFVPVETDITLPRDPPRNSRVDKLERLLAAIEDNRAGVLENMAYMAERERLAILQYGRQREAIEGFPASNPSLPPDEVDWIMENMAAPAPRDRDLNVKDDEELQKVLLRTRLGVPPPEGLETNREQVARDLLNTANHAAKVQTDYSREVDKRVAEYSKLLEKEKRRMDEVGKRPERPVRRY